MNRFLNSKKELEKFLETYDPLVDERLLFTISENRTYIIYPEEYIKWDGKWCKYLGFVNSSKDVPNINSFYRIGRRVYYHPARVEQIDFSKVSGTDIKKVDDSEFFNVEVKENDNELMVIAKEMLKNVRVNTFKEMFKSSSDYNNVRREITNGNGRLSWDRFLLICNLLGFDHVLKVHKNIALKDIQGKSK